MAYVPGELKPFYGKKETVYGQTPTASLDFLGEAIDATLKIDPHQTKDTWSDSRAYAPKSCVFEDEQAALQLSAQMHASTAGYDWRDGLVEMALGAMTGTSPLGRLPSYSLLVELTQGSNVGQYLFNGCKVKNLTIDVPNQGARPTFAAEVWARHARKVGADRVVTGLQSLTLGANEAVPTSAILQWKAPMTLVAGSSRTIYPQSWKLKVENNLQREQGGITGADSQNYAVARALHEGKLDIDFECDLYLEDLVIVDEMLANQAITSLSTSIGGNTLTLSNGHYKVDSGSWPTFRQDVLKHTVKLMFTGVSIA